MKHSEIIQKIKDLGAVFSLEEKGEIFIVVGITDPENVTLGITSIMGKSYNFNYDIDTETYVFRREYKVKKNLHRVIPTIIGRIEKIFCDSVWLCNSVKSKFIGFEFNVSFNNKVVLNYKFEKEASQKQIGIVSDEDFKQSTIVNYSEFEYDLNMIKINLEYQKLESLAMVAKKIIENNPDIHYVYFSSYGVYLISVSSIIDNSAEFKIKREPYGDSAKLNLNIIQCLFNRDKEIGPEAVNLRIVTYQSSEKITKTYTNSYKEFLSGFKPISEVPSSKILANLKNRQKEW